VGEGEDQEEDEEEWQWEEVDAEEDGVGEAVTEAKNLSSEEVEFDQEVEEVGCTINNGAPERGDNDPENLFEPPKHNLEGKSTEQPEYRLEGNTTILENKVAGRACVEAIKAKISFVKDAIAEDSMWDSSEEEHKQENLREEMCEEEVKAEGLQDEVREEEFKEGEQLRELLSEDKLMEEELKDVVTISVQDCTVLNLDVVFEAPEMFNIPGNFKEQVSDEFSPASCESKVTKRKGRPVKVTRRKRSKH